MSEIRFIEQQGDLLVQAASTAGRSPHRRRWLLQRAWAAVQAHRRLAVVAVALALAGCAAAVTTVLGPGERLALGQVDCYNATGLEYPGGGLSFLALGITRQGPETPAAMCEGYFKAPGALHIRGPRLVSCIRNTTTVAVLAFSGRGGSCRQAGLSPLPASYAAATAAVDVLVLHLRALYRRRDCWAPRAFAVAVRGQLAKRGFNGWRVLLPSTIRRSGEMPIGEGRCAQFQDLGNSYSSLNGGSRTVSLSLGLPRSINTVINRADHEMSRSTWRHCYSNSAALRLADRTFAGTGLTPEVAITADPNARLGYSWGTRAEAEHWNAGCRLLLEAWPALNDRIVYVWFTARDGEPLTPPTHSPLLLPSLADFHR